MRKQGFFKRLPTPQSLKKNRFLKPFGHYLNYHFLWQFNRRTVAGGVATGVFFGILFPFLQIFMAALAAVLLRVNLPVAAFSTLVTNPLTFPAIYYLGYRLGDILTGSEPLPPEKQIEADIAHAIKVQQGDAESWFPGLIDWMQSVGVPLAVGLIVLASAAALVGYFTVSTIWKLRVRMRWRQRKLKRAKGNAATH